MADSNGERSTSPEHVRSQLTPVQRRLITGVALGAAAIAVIGFVGSYAAVRSLAEAKDFGAFAVIFPVGLDAGILVLLALDLLLTWLRMPLALLRQTAWLLSAATIAFNAAAAWPDPLGVGMHAVTPVLFVVVVEAARHAIGVAADINAAKHMEGVRLSRWLLAPLSTFLLWRRMKLWELRSYDTVIELEQQRRVERARLRQRYGLMWRSKAPVAAVMALRLTRYGRPLAPAEGVLDIEPAPTGAPVPPALDPAQGAPGRPAPADQGAPTPPPAPSAARPSGGPKRPEPAPDDEPQRPEGDTNGGGDNGEGERDEARPPTRDEAKRKVRALYDELDARPKEGQIVVLLNALAGYPHTSRRHAQRLRDEIEAKEPKLAERGSTNVRALTGT